MFVLYKKKNFRYLTLGKKRINGRNYIKVTVYHRGGGNKRNFRLIDYLRYIWNISGVVLRREYDPNKRVILNLILYANGILVYVLAVAGVNIGSKVLNSVFFFKPIYGYSTLLLNFKSGHIINNVELQLNLGSKIVRSQGNYAKILTKISHDNVLIKLRKSQKVFKINSFCLATFGIILKMKMKRNCWGKAGYTRSRGWRPHVRGYAMNPVDHPHGGRTKSGIKVSIWGKDTKGKKTCKRLSYYEVKVKR